ncbi:hypothetical protein GJ496_008319 [Pomphorhynchus laevis]|nr:hypothetical protein GJ496_008319 [Pomphorhynchus laevis]
MQAKGNLSQLSLIHDGPIENGASNNVFKITIDEKLSNIIFKTESSLISLNNHLLQSVVLANGGLFDAVSSLCSIFLLQNFEITYRIGNIFRKFLLKYETSSQISQSIVIIANFRSSLRNVFNCKRCVSYTFSLDMSKCVCLNDGFDIIDSTYLTCSLPSWMEEIIDTSSYVITYRFRMKLLYSAIVLEDILKLLRSNEKDHFFRLLRFHELYLHRYEMYHFVQSLRAFSEQLIKTQLDGFQHTLKNICQFDNIKDVHKDFVEFSQGCWIIRNSISVQENSFSIAVSSICKLILEYWKSIVALFTNKHDDQTLNLESINRTYLIFKKRLHTFLSALRVFIVKLPGSPMESLLLTLDFNGFYSKH